MKVLHLLASAGTGGIETLCKDILIKADWDNRICCLFDEGETYEYLKSNNRKIFSLKDKNRDIKKIVEFLKQYCIKENIDIVTIHHGGITCNMIYILLKRKLPNLKYVRYLHGCFDKYAFGNDKGIINRSLGKMVMQKAFDCSDLLIFISKAVEKSFEIKFNIKNNKKVIIYNGIDEKFFNESKRKKNKKYNTTNIIFVGRLSYVKGIDILIKAFKEVSQKNNNMFLTIVGDGEEKERLVNLTKELNVSDKIKFVGRQPNVIEWLDNADIFVYPSIWEEGFGISVVEAMARGCIPIVSNGGGLTEIVEDDKNGIIFTKKENKELACAIEKILNMNNEKKREMIKEAIETSKNFSINITVEDLKKEYCEIIHI